MSSDKTWASPKNLSKKDCLEEMNFSTEAGNVVIDVFSLVFDAA